MIQANELRLGNWLLGCNNTYLQVNEDSFQVLSLKDQSDDCPSAILLNGKILEACSIRHYYSLKGVDYYRLGNGGFLNLVLTAPKKTYDFKLSIFKGDKIDIPVKHLHQLQNLYFALTGTELQITL